MVVMHLLENKFFYYSDVLKIVNNDASGYLTRNFDFYIPLPREFLGNILLRVLPWDANFYITVAAQPLKECLVDIDF